MELLLVLTSVLAVASAASFSRVVLEEWKTFKASHGKLYDNASEEDYRLRIFIESKVQIARHNAKFARGQVTYTMGLNQFSDMPYWEFNRIMNGDISSAEDWFGVEDEEVFTSPEDVEIPASFDWREHGAVTSVKSQGHCGSCWSFSATGALEGQHFRKTGELIPLSEQNLIDCTRGYGNNGCRGGSKAISFEYIKDNRGIDTEDSYPYEAKDGQRCRYRTSSRGATDSGIMKVRKSEEALLRAVAFVGPISVSIDAQESFQHYAEGVYFEGDCSDKHTNHAVLVVGYGTEHTGGDYWLVKNSWGTKWGEDGYVKMARNRNNNCAIASFACFPKVSR